MTLIQTRPAWREAIELGLALLALFATAVAIVVFRLQNFEEAGAYIGFSPTALALPFWSSPEFLASNFDGGETESLKSLAVAVYPLTGWLGISPVVTFAVMLFAEIAALAAGAFVAARRLNPGASQAAAIVAALLLVAGTLINCDLARWGHP